MSDYNAVIYDEQGSTKRVYESGGELEMQSGSLFDQQSGSSMTLAGTVNVSGTLKNSKIETLSTAFTVANYGLSVLAATAAATFTLDAPVAGVEKQIVLNSTWLTYLKGSTASTVFFGSTAGGNIMVITPTSVGDSDLSGPALLLRGGSSVLWYVMSASTIAWASATST